jgi:hypothetical protein
MRHGATRRVAYRSDPAENGQYRVKLKVRQENVAEDFQMDVPVTLDLGNDRVARVRVKVRGPTSEIDLSSHALETEGIPLQRPRWRAGGGQDGRLAGMRRSIFWGRSAG